MSRQLFFIFPALNSLVKALAPIIGKEIPYICIVFKLLVNFCLTVFLFFKYPIIRSNRIGISFTRIAFKPFLKCYIKRKSVADMFLKNALCFSEQTKFGSISVSVVMLPIICDFFCTFFAAITSPVSRKCAILSVISSFPPDVGKPYRRQKPTSSYFK